MIKELCRFREPLLITPEAANAWIDALTAPIESRSVEIFGNKIDLPGSRIEKGVAVIPIKGVVAVNVSPFEKLFGVVDMADISEEIADAEANEEVTAIVFDIDSPGGTFNGTPELAAQIANASKPTFAFTSGMAASAAYFLMAGAENALAAPSATVGHIGTFAAYKSIAKALEAQGVDVTVIASDSLKLAGNPLVEMTQEHYEFLKSRIESATKVFRDFVAAQRPVDAEHMRGQTYFGAEAYAVNLIDAAASNLAAVIDFARQK